VAHPTGTINSNPYGLVGKMHLFLITVRVARSTT
jgi:hypothetical protein